jgi:hypothetical protein
MMKGILIKEEKLYNLKHLAYPDWVETKLVFHENHIETKLVYGKLVPYLVKVTATRNNKYLVLVFANSSTLAVKFVADHYTDLKKIELVEIGNTWLVSRYLPKDSKGNVIKNQKKLAKLEEHLTWKE